MVAFECLYKCIAKILHDKSYSCRFNKAFGLVLRTIVKTGRVNTATYIACPQLHAHLRYYILLHVQHTPPITAHNMSKVCNC